MDLRLATIDVWTFPDEFSPPSFLRQLQTLLQDGDVIAVGAYCPSPRTRAILTDLGATDVDADTIYNTCFQLNRRDHPNGRSFEFPKTSATLAFLITEAERSGGQDDKPLFFDHIVAYRRGFPVVPLLSFHDAFYGGTLRVSGLYPESAIRTFAAGLPSTYVSKPSADGYTSDVQPV
jgi:hypothetical protein